MGDKRVFYFYGDMLFMETSFLFFIKEIVHPCLVFSASLIFLQLLGLLLVLRGSSTLQARLRIALL
jgi:hypothetical protein